MQVTARGLYEQAKKSLAENGIDSADYDSLLLIEKCLGMSRQDIILYGDRYISDDKRLEFEQLVDQRVSGIPLQYILGSWEFFGLPFKVGKGVLIPRADTEILVETVIDNSAHIKAPIIADLCAGSGAIGISLAKNMQAKKIFLIEKSKDALPYLIENISLNNASCCEAVEGDIFNCCDMFEDASIDIIVSNPPYIESDIIKTLQKEVQYEPKSALDGGSDGLDFYKCIADKWRAKLKPNGILAFEIGYDQGEEVSDLLKSFSKIKLFKDYGDNDRVIIAVK